MQLIDEVTKFSTELQKIRRDIHAHPELCYEERRTADVIAKKLKEWGIPIRSGFAGTGLVGVIKSGSSERAIGLRADMDALPMNEMNTFAHASQHPGKMHACGHDGHTAMLLGAARYLSEHRHFDGTVYLIFQPAEESGTGAKQMIEDGLFKQCQMQAVFGMHNWPGMATGSFGVVPGPMMASANTFEVVIKGKGSHAAQPHQGIDPVMVAVQIAQSWQTIVTRNKNPVDTGVLSITQIHAGSANNVIPDTAVLAGTVRTFRAEVLDLLERRMHDVAYHTALAFGAEIEFAFTRGCPALLNHPEETAVVINVLHDLVGAKQVNAQIAPTMSAEDFSFMLQEMPGCYVFIGNGADDHGDMVHGKGPCNLHNPSYDFNDDLLAIGTSYWIKLVESCLTR